MQRFFIFAYLAMMIRMAYSVSSQKEALPTKSGRLDSFLQAKSSSEPSFIRLHEETPYERKVEKFRRKSDHHREMSVRTPQGLGIRKKTERPINHNKKQRKWSERELVLFNNDYDGMMDQAHLHSVREALMSDPVKKLRARKNKEFWYQQAEETAGKPPLYKQHTVNMNFDSMFKSLNYVGEKSHKYDGRVSAITYGKIKAIQSLEKEAHIKALKAKQYKEDWQSLSTAKRPDHLIPPPLDAFSTNFKEDLHVSQDRPMLPSSERRKLVDTTEAKKVKHLPPKGYAINLNRIEDKLKSSKNMYDEVKWSSRKAAVQSDYDSADRIYEIIHYHNKEISKRWNQLHWGSVAYQMAKKAAAKSQQAESSSARDHSQ